MGDNYYEMPAGGSYNYSSRDYQQNNSYTDNWQDGNNYPGSWREGERYNNNNRSNRSNSRGGSQHGRGSNKNRGSQRNLRRRNSNRGRGYCGGGANAIKQENCDSNPFTKFQDPLQQKKNLKANTITNITFPVQVQQKQDLVSNTVTNFEDPSEQKKDQPPNTVTDKIKVKVEKTEQERKQTAVKPPPASSSSSSSSSSEDETVIASVKMENPKNDKSNVKASIKQENVVKTKAPKVENPVKPSSSSSSSSSSSESESSDSSEDNTKKSAEPSKATIKSSTALKKNEKPSEDDVICVGNLENTFFLDDDDDDKIENNKYNEAKKQVKSNAKKESGKKAIDQCRICAKQGHISFQCQMICKNCSAPYHNLKSCPMPPNLTVMMQCFMEFCMQQLNNFNPELKFPLHSNLYMSGTAAEYFANMPTAAAIQPPASAMYNSKTKLKATKTKVIAKKNYKRKRHQADESDDDDDDDDESEEKKQEPETSVSDSSSVPSEKMITTKQKKKRSRTTKATKTGIQSPFSARNFTTLPSSFIGAHNFAQPTTAAAALAFNPLLFSQMMQHGAFPTIPTLNFKQ